MAEIMVLMSWSRLLHMRLHSSLQWLRIMVLLSLRLVILDGTGASDIRVTTLCAGVAMVLGIGVVSIPKRFVGTIAPLEAYSTIISSMLGNMLHRDALGSHHLGSALKISLLFVSAW